MAKKLDNSFDGYVYLKLSVDVRRELSPAICSLAVDFIIIFPIFSSYIFCQTQGAKSHYILSALFSPLIKVELNKFTWDGEEPRTTRSLGSGTISIARYCIKI